MRLSRVLAAAFAAAVFASVQGAGDQSYAAEAAPPPPAPAAPAKPNVVVLNPQAAAPEAPAAVAAPARADTPASPQRPETVAPPSPAAEAATPPAGEAVAATAGHEPVSKGDASGNDGSAASDAGTDDAASERSAEGAATDGKDVAAAPTPAPEPTLSIDIDLTKQMMRVAENGASKYVWPVSSGRYGYTTPTGTFTPTWTSRMWYSKQYDYAPMPYAVFFHGGAAIHGTYATGALGRPASHGCVRLATSNAATLYRLVGKHGRAMTRIVVHGTPNHDGEAVASRDGYSRYGDDYDSRRRPRYAPPGAYYAYDDVPDYYPPRSRRYYAPQPRGRYYVRPRGLFNNGYVGYGF